MKNLILFASFLLLSVDVISQCEPPHLVDWFAEANDNYTIQFNPSSGSTDYTITVTPFYNDQIQTPLPEPIVYTGQTTEGTNLVSFDPSPAHPGDVPEQSYFYAIDLSTTCNGEEYGAEQFYMSRISLLNTPAYNCQNFNVYNYPLPDGSGVSYDIPFEIESSDIPVEIDQLSVFLDIGHTFLGDLSITLTSPSGTTVSLLEYSNGFGGSHGLSVFFQEGAPAPELTEPEDIQPYLQGIYAPSESFSAFSGETVAGTWVISVTDNLGADYGMLFGSCLNINTSPCETSTSGQVYYDSNDNGQFDDNEIPLDYSFISINGYEHSFSNPSGEYYQCAEPGAVNLELANVPLYHEINPSSYELELVSGDNLEELDFALVPIPGINDLLIDVYSVIPDVPGFERTYYISYSNVGTECIDNVEVSFTSPEGTSIISANEGLEGVIDANNVSLSVGTLCPYESGLIAVELMVSEEVEVGSVIIYTASITPIEGDETQGDNYNGYESLVVASYDPNDKTPSETSVNSQFIDEGKSLEYIIRFQNDGTFYAENVIITDLVEEDLLLETFELLGSSHPLEVTLDDRELSFEFIGIQLPQSDLGLEESQGYVRFRMQPVEGFSNGDVILNTAAIYFDFNSPIITNTAVTVFDNSVSIVDIDRDGIKLYPNPASENINLELSSNSEFISAQLFDLSGRIISTLDIRGLSLITVETGDLKSGVYSVKLKSSEGFESVHSFVKK